MDGGIVGRERYGTRPIPPGIGVGMTGPALPPYPTPCGDQPQPPLMEVVGYTAKCAAGLHNLLDDLEQTLFGPFPGCEAKPLVSTQSIGGYALAARSDVERAETRLQHILNQLRADPIPKTAMGGR